MLSNFWESLEQNEWKNHNIESVTNLYLSSNDNPVKTKTIKQKKHINVVQPNFNTRRSLLAIHVCLVDGLYGFEATRIGTRGQSYEVDHRE